MELHLHSSGGGIHKCVCWRNTQPSSFPQNCIRSVVMEMKRLWVPPGRPRGGAQPGLGARPLQHAYGCATQGTGVGDIWESLLSSTLPPTSPGRHGLVSDVNSSLIATSGTFSRASAYLHLELPREPSLALQGRT